MLYTYGLILVNTGRYVKMISVLFMYSGALLRSKKRNRSIPAERNIYVNTSYQLSEKNTPYFC